MVRDQETIRLVTQSAGLVATAEMLLGELEGHTERLARFVHTFGMHDLDLDANDRSRPDSSTAAPKESP